MNKSDNLSERVDLRSMNVAADKRANLKQLFPSVFTEIKDDKGKLSESIDLEKLKAELGTFSEIFEARRERYGMDWPGKKECMKLVQQPSIGTLRPCREESVNFDTTQNLFIEGDNLEVLKLLQKSYYGNVKMIYIDPPYNTGKEFIYPDKYAESLETYLAYAGLADSEGKKFSTNTPNEGRFHTRWLNMMYPRLYLARNLLGKDGIILISIGEEELVNLKYLCDEIYGELNYYATINWTATTKAMNAGDAKYKIQKSEEYILIYGKVSMQEHTPFKLEKKGERQYPLTSDDGRKYRLEEVQQRKNIGIKRSEKMVFKILGTYPKDGFRWTIGEDTARKLESGKDVLISDDKIIRIIYQDEETEGIYYPFWANFSDGYGTSESGKAILADLMGQDLGYETVKPIQIMKRLLFHFTDPNDIVIDFFAGSCTTAHGVLDINKEDNGARKYIMVQLPELCEENTEAFKAGYKNIADIGKERIRRVIKKIEAERTTKTRKAEGKLPGMGENQSSIDLGFKVLKLDRSNFRIWDGSNLDASEEELARQLEMHIEHIDIDATQEDILYELLLKEGFMPTEKIEKHTMAGKVVFSVAEGAFLICLEDEITRELIDAIAEANPLRFVCLDRGFKGNDQLKANAKQTFDARNQGREKATQIVFRTI